jgi:CPA2 family monovalent cation:H+ antiporter-2
MEVLKDLMIVLLCAAMVLVMTYRLRIPSVIGFLLTGILIGPGVLSLIPDSQQISVLSEIGVMLLMFSVGLEFSIEKLRQMKYEVLVIGGMQILLTIAAVTSVCMLMGLSLPVAMFASFVISLSSTAILLKLLQDRQKLQTPAGRIMLGVLLFQDICVVPLIILTPTLASLGNADFMPVAYKLLRSFSLIVIIFVASKYVLPRFFDFVMRLRISELYMFMVLGFCFGLALVTHFLGFSLALGSFIAGMVLAESDYINQIESDTRQLKNVFLSVFFISVGMLLNIDFVFSHALGVASGLLGMIALKILVMLVILKFTRNPLNIALYVGMGLAQIGEFSFLLLNIARPSGIIDENTYQYFLSITIFSMMVTPLLVATAMKLGDSDAMKKNISKLPEGQPQPDVIIAGFGINGINLSKIFKALSIPYRVIEINPATVKKFRSKGERIVYGDITQPANLTMMGIENASMIVIAISDADATKKAVEISRKMNPSIQIIVRSEYVTQIESLYRCGANIVISQDFEASIEVASYVLKHFGVANRIVHIQANALRKQHYKFFMHEGVFSHKVNLAKLAAIEKLHEIFFVLLDSTLIGKKITEIHFPDDMGCVGIIGVIRDGVVLTSQNAEVVIEPADTFILYGDQKKLHRAISFLESFRDQKPQDINPS